VVWFLLACSKPSVAPLPEPEPVVVPEPPPPPPEPVIEPLPTEGAFRREVAPGLVVAAYDPPDIPDLGYSRAPTSELEGTDRRIFVVTIDPAHYGFRYLSVLDDSVTPGHKTAAEWAEVNDLHVAFNPGMFEPGYEPTGYTRSGSFVPQPMVRQHKLYRGWFVAGETVSVVDQVPPKASSGNYSRFDQVPDEVRGRFDAADVVSQSLPIVLGGKAAYPPRTKHWSELAYGADAEGRVVVVFSRYPYEMREFGARVVALELGIDGLIHGEGGPEATLVVKAGGVELLNVGSYETGFYDDRNERPWMLPAVIGAVPKG